MKKYFYTTFFTVFILSVMGFRGCGEGYTNFIAALFYYHATGEFLDSLATDASGENAIYNIAVGKSGEIYTGEGRSPSYWVERPSGTTQNLNFVRVYDNSDSLITYAVGDGGTVLLSRDKGLTWVDRSIPSLTANLYGLDYFYVSYGVGIVVCGESGIICISTDSGINWTQHSTITTNKLNSIMAYGGDNVVAVGENGAIIKGGPQFGWYDNSVSPNIQLYRIFPGIELSWSKLWVVGSGGKIYYSSDYGESWGQQSSGTTEDLYDVKFRSATDGVVAGKNGVVRYTTDAGTSWHEDTYLSGLTTRDIVSISGADSNTAIALTVNDFNGDSQGADTTFFLSVSSEPFVGVDDEENLTLSEFRLEQNYPNPFNPSTRIEYKILHPGFVSLKVYDMLGNEITTLVNEEKNAGKYEISFDASGLTSGIYFYKLITNNFSETKKLVLMK
jgi:photosystem II stability/assembly factor-like uncharacterized protein